jgi:hypothetical protein
MPGGGKLERMLAAGSRHTIRSSCRVSERAAEYDPDTDAQSPVADAWRWSGYRGRRSHLVASRLSDTVNTAARPQLEPGEQIEATFPLATSGMSPWLASSFGALGALIGLKVTKRYAVVVTDRRLLLLRQGGLLKATYALEAAYPRSDVRVVTYNPGTLYGKLGLDLPAASGASAQQLGLHIQRYVRNDAEAVVTTLGYQRA